jgi:hypothetical protein
MAWARHSLERAVERLRPALLHDFGQRLCGFFDRLVRIRYLGAGNRDEPMRVGECHTVHESAVPASSAGLELLPLAQDQLGPPECQALLADARGS